MIEIITFHPILLAMFQGFWFIIPAYAANGMAPFPQGKRPLDFGKSWYGKRILGDGKTIEGTIAGFLGGLLWGFVLILFQTYVQVNTGIGINQDLGLVIMNWPLIILIVTGALLGDIIGSFAKRRLDLDRGAKFPIVDQLGFVIVALLLASPIYLPSLGAIAFILASTLFVHLFGNYIGYKIKLKKVPW
ncbi:MAG: CDP-2,3-bis-(O-geranylgeranyl)-sn-glycerol synthase [Candidatus Aenigmarchaeota archaeon]|nr:CDP-2,3-bis-(O-geranylgeranyl)-sn-glycerol synthase [Candidatus Aenigmarchaeota archaeon]